MPDMIFDLETMGTDVSSHAIVSLAKLVFDRNRFLSDTEYYTLQSIRAEAEFYKFDIEEQVKKYGRAIDMDTLKDFWQTQVSEAARIKQLTPRADDLSIAQIPELLSFSVPKSEKGNVWTRGNTFDPMFITSICKTLGVQEPYHWWLVRDTRSYLDGLLFGSNEPNSFTPAGSNGVDLHDPVDDIALDVLRMQQCYRLIEGLSVPFLEEEEDDIPF